MSEREDGYVQALRDMKEWLQRHRAERRNPNWAEAHEEAVDHIDDLLMARGRPINAAEEPVVMGGSITEAPRPLRSE
jgi:hypothetical protein